jgi:hypothetical protein
LKWFSKTDDLIRWAHVVTCGNRGIAEYVSGKGANARVVPTVVDTNVFKPDSGDIRRSSLVLGWIGTHSTFPYLESIFPVLGDLARAHKFRLKVVGAGKESISVPGVEVENSAWEIDREVDFAHLERTLMEEGLAKIPIRFDDFALHELPVDLFGEAADRRVRRQGAGEAPLDPSRFRIPETEIELGEREHPLNGRARGQLLEHEVLAVGVGERDRSDGRSLRDRLRLLRPRRGTHRQTESKCGNDVTESSHGKPFLFTS